MSLTISILPKPVTRSVQIQLKAKGDPRAKVPAARQNVRTVERRMMPDTMLFKPPDFSFATAFAGSMALVFMSISTFNPPPSP